MFRDPQMNSTPFLPGVQLGVPEDLEFRTFRTMQYRSFLLGRSIFGSPADRMNSSESPDSHSSSALSKILGVAVDLLKVVAETPRTPLPPALSSWIVFSTLSMAVYSGFCPYLSILFFSGFSC